MIPIIDIFAGPGGLGEGFSSLLHENKERVFKIKLSIEKDSHAHQTLKLRSFFRAFRVGCVPEEYYKFVRGEMTLEDLYKTYPEEAASADKEAWCGTLGKPDKEDKNGLSNDMVDSKIKEVLSGYSNWVLIGGPPCQAYSLVGRSRRKEKILDERKDNRVGLYKEYLRIIAVHKPSIFVMENVKGLLSAQTADDNLFSKILNDLTNPVEASLSEGDITDGNIPRIKYKIYSLVTKVNKFDIFQNPIFKPNDFVIRTEEYGVPQRRHRVILLGVREDIKGTIGTLEKQSELSLESVIGGLPCIRSGISKSISHTSTIGAQTGTVKKRRFYEKIKDSYETWSSHIQNFNNQVTTILGYSSNNKNIGSLSRGREFISTENYSLPNEHPLRKWYYDKKLGGVIHHVSRTHLLEDIKRYHFACCFVEKYGKFPKLDDFKKAGNEFLPDHENAESGKFIDRFRVQLPNIPATTITSHISKDGHYFIHYDSKQSRSFTVREAARVQTFPDNYYFCGGRTQQFHQVGNAVPPYLAYQIAQIVKNILPDENE